jgi:hypothetical protein
MSVDRNNATRGRRETGVATSDAYTTSAARSAAIETGHADDHRAVSSNWSDPILVSERELIVLELYLADAIDQLLGPKRRQSKGTTQARGPP